MQFFGYFEKYLHANGWETERASEAREAPVHLVARQQGYECAIKLIDDAEAQPRAEEIRALAEDAASRGLNAAACVSLGEFGAAARRAAKEASPPVVLIGGADLGKAAKLLDAAGQRAPKAKKRGKPLGWKMVAAGILMPAAAVAAWILMREPPAAPQVEAGVPETQAFAPDPARLATPVTPEERAALAARLKSIQIGLLPDPQSPAPMWLADLGVPPRGLSWEEVVAPEFSPAAYPIILYAMHENYRATVASPGDVDAALQRYMESGGLLVMLSSGPFPFYYEGNNVVVTGRVYQGEPRGFRIDNPGGWEIPPVGFEFAFHASAARMPHVPGVMPFPREGDQRWRPMWPRPLAGMNYEKLIELRDTSGKHWGDACALVTGPKANVLYGWFRLQDGAAAEGFTFDVFWAAAEFAESARR